MPGHRYLTRVRCPIWTSWKSLQIWFRTWLCADLARVHLFLLSVLSNASAMNMRNISAIRNAVQKYVLLFVSSTSTLSSVLAAVNAQRTVRQVRSQVRLNIHITLITTSVSNAVHVRTTVTLMQYMWKHRREDTLWAI